MEETNPAYLEAHEGEATIGEIIKEASLSEPTRECAPGIEVFDLNMKIDVKGNSFDQVSQVADCIVDCINSSVQDIGHDQVKVTERANIDEGDLSNIQDSKEESSKDTHIIARIVEHDVGFLIPKKFF